MREILPRIEGLHAAGERIVLAVLVSAWRLAPRPVGSVMAIGSGGTIVGSLTGGCVEAELAVAAGEVLAAGTPQRRRYAIEDERACAVGLPCGGEVEVLLVELDAAGLEAVRAAVAAQRRADLVLSGAGELAIAPPAPLTGEELVRIPLGPPPLLVVVGAVDLAEPLCAGARLLGRRTLVVDPRAALATPTRLPSADAVEAAWPADVLARLDLDETAAVVVLTHQDPVDLPALAAALRSDAGYVGALGSRRTQARRREALAAEGLTDAELARLHGPCGLDIGAATPAEIAVAILAELVAAGSGSAGGSLRDREGAIHERASQSERVTA
jgi:xanthine dehydrogenase accessory factor